MGKHNKQAITASPPQSRRDGIQAQAPAPRLPVLPNQAAGLSPWRLAGALFLGVGVPLAVVLAVVWADRNQPVEGGLEKKVPRTSKSSRQPGWGLADLIAAARGQNGESKPQRPRAWEVATAEDRVIDDFMRLHNTESPKAPALLGLAGKVAMTDRVLTEGEERTLTAEHFLRSDALRITDIWRGEPDDNGAQRARPGRYTLITRGAGSTPLYRVVSSRSRTQQHLSNPDLIVDVRGGKIFGVRADCHRGP